MPWCLRAAVQSTPQQIVKQQSGDAAEADVQRPSDGSAPDAAPVPRVLLGSAMLLVGPRRSRVFRLCQSMHTLLVAALHREEATAALNTQLCNEMSNLKAHIAGLQCELQDCQVRLHYRVPEKPGNGGGALRSLTFQFGVVLQADLADSKNRQKLLFTTASVRGPRVSSALVRSHRP